MKQILSLYINAHHLFIFPFGIGLSLLSILLVFSTSSINCDTNPNSNPDNAEGMDYRDENVGGDNLGESTGQAHPQIDLEAYKAKLIQQMRQQQAQNTDASHGPFSQQNQRNYEADYEQETEQGYFDGEAPPY